MAEMAIGTLLHIAPYHRYLVRAGYLWYVCDAEG